MGNIFSDAIHFIGNAGSTILNGADAAINVLKGVGDALDGNSSDAKNDFSKAGSKFLAAGNDIANAGGGIYKMGKSAVSAAEDIPSDIQNLKNIHSFGDFAESVWHDTAGVAKSFGQAIESNGVYIGNGFLTGALDMADLGVDTVEAGVSDVQGLVNAGYYVTHHACDIAVGSALSAVFATIAADGEEEVAVTSIAALAAANLIDKTKAHAAATVLADILTPSIWLIPGVSTAFDGKKNILQDVIQFVIEHTLEKKRKLLVSTAGQVLVGALIYTVTDVICSGNLPGGFRVWKGLQGDADKSPASTASGSKTSPTNSSNTKTPIKKRTPLDPLPMNVVKTFELTKKFMVTKSGMDVYCELVLPPGYKILSGGGYVSNKHNAFYISGNAPIKANNSSTINAWVITANNHGVKHHKKEETIHVRAIGIYDPNDVLKIDFLTDNPIDILASGESKENSCFMVEAPPYSIITGVGGYYNSGGKKWLVGCHPHYDVKKHVLSAWVSGVNKTKDGDKPVCGAVCLTWSDPDNWNKYQLRLLHSHLRETPIINASFVPGAIMVGGGVRNSSYKSKLTMTCPAINEAQWFVNNNDNADAFPSSYSISIYGLPGKLFVAPPSNIDFAKSDPTLVNKKR